MKPREIQVFDGLRLTTEHMNHLQGAFQSAVQDMRQIAGLGRVHHGFELVKENEGQLVVLPGTAFDWEGNRIVSDERRDLPIEFAEGETTKFVCVAYQELEDGLVEGRPTLIWDSCAISLCATLPDRDENVVPVGALVRQPDTSSFIVQSLEELASQDAQSETAGAEETTNAQDEVTESEAGEGEEQVREEVVETSAETEEAGKSSGEDALEPDEDVSAPAAPPPATTAATPWLPMRQGLLRLGSAAESGVVLNNLLLEALRRRLEGAVNGAELYVPMAEEALSLDFSPLSVTTQTILRATLTLEALGAGEVDAPAALPHRRDLQAMAQGEASRNGQGFAQVGLVAVEDDLRSFRASGSRALYDATESGLAHLPLGAGEDQAENEEVSERWAFLDGLQLVLVVQETQPPQTSVAVKLRWVGGVDEKTIEMFETRQVRLVWTSVMAWKALGSPLI